jgi:hypothetical protein
MTELEEELRQHFRAVADGAQQGLLRPLRPPAPKRRSGLIRWLAPVAAVAAVAGLIAGITIAGRAERAAPISNGAVSGMPKYYLTLNPAWRAGRQVLLAVVRSSETGATVSSVKVMNTLPLQPVTVDAAADDRVFLISSVIPAEVEVLRLSPDGHVRQLVRLPAKVGNEASDGILSPNGASIVVAFQSCPRPTSCDSGVAMISATTGAREKTWLGGGMPDNWLGAGPDVFISVGDGYRLLDVAGPGGSLLANSSPVRVPAVPRGWVGFGVHLLPGGKFLLITYLKGVPVRPGRSVTEHIDQTPVGSKSGGRILFAAANPAKPTTLSFCEPLSLGPAQVNVLVACPSGLGRLHGSRFTRLPGFSASQGLDQAAAW